MKKIKTLIVDDHKLIRDGIKIMLGSQKNNVQFEIKEAESAEEALLLINDNDFDIILMDYQLPQMNGADAVSRITTDNTAAKILALSNYDEYNYIKRMMDSGAKGYVLKNIGPLELISAIETILSGKNYYANEVAIKLIHEKSTGRSGVAERIYNTGITKREVEILKLIANEMTNDEIAQHLCIKKRTVDTHRQNLLNKLGAKNTVGLVKCAYELKLI